MLVLTEPTNSPFVYVQLVVIFTSFNTFRLILKERSEMCQRDGRLGVVRDGRCSSLSGFTQKKCYFTVLRHIFIFLTCKIIF